uniref:Uncharacterized protein n=1 Tax=Moniliophthora roreri TaxID=221103 RepID=A0A0W0FB68_MONRR
MGSNLQIPFKKHGDAVVTKKQKATIKGRPGIKHSQCNTSSHNADTLPSTRLHPDTDMKGPRAMKHNIIHDAEEINDQPAPKCQQKNGDLHAADLKKQVNAERRWAKDRERKKL